MAEETYCSAMHCPEREAEVDPGDVDQQGRHAHYDRDGTLEIHRGAQSCGAPIPRLDEGPCEYVERFETPWSRAETSTLKCLWPKDDPHPTTSATCSPSWRRRTSASRRS